LQGDTTKPQKAVALTYVEPHRHKPLDAYGSATVELLRIDARGRVHPHARRGGTLRRAGLRGLAARVATLTFVQLLAFAAGVDVLALLQIYAALVGVGLLPGLQYRSGDNSRLRVNLDDSDYASHGPRP
jgi:hypothetical protein